MILKIFSSRAAKEWKETYLWALKKNRGLMGLLTLLLMIALPVILLIVFSQVASRLPPDDCNGMFSSYFVGCSTFAVMPLLLLFTLVLSATLFSYLHQKRSVDLFHSIPVSRTALLLGRWCAALTVLMVPVLLSYAAAGAVGLHFGVRAQYALAAPLLHLLQNLLMIAAALSFSVLIAVCTGTTFDMILSILAINAAYPLLIFAGTELAKWMLPSVGWDIQLTSVVLTAFAPFAAACLPFPNPYFTVVNSFPSLGAMQDVFLSWWIVMTFVLLAACILLYQRRKSECAESGFAFAAPQFIIRFLVTAVSGIGMGFAFLLSTNGLPLFFFGALLGSLTAHIIVEGVYSRGFKHLKKSFTSYGIFAALFLAFYCILATGFFGYDTWVPPAEEIESISILSVNAQQEDYYPGSQSILDKTGRTVATLHPKIRQKENIKAAAASISDYLNVVRRTDYPYSLRSIHSYGNLTLEFHLKNGSSVKRFYRAWEPDVSNAAFNKMIQSLISTTEYIESSRLVFYIEPQMIKSVDIRRKDGDDSNTFAPDDNQKEELLAAMKKDYDGLTPSQQENEDPPIFLSVDLRNDIVPSGRLRELTGNYGGEVQLPAISFYISDRTPNLKVLMKKFGWL